MKFVYVRLFIFVVVVFSLVSAFKVVAFCSGSSHSERLPVTGSSDMVAVESDSDRWQIVGSEARIEDYLGRKSIYLKEGNAFLKDVDFENGVIEVDMAVPDSREFIGIKFRVDQEKSYETIYFRPHKSGLEDAIQYMPAFNGSTTWQLYSGKGFNSAVEIPKEKWIHIRIEISGLGAKLFFNNGAEPALIIEDLKRGYSHGSLGLWGSLSGGHFSNFSYKLDSVVSRPERMPTPIPAGILTKWELSDAFDIDKKDTEMMPSPAEMQTMKWQPVSVETPGMLVIDRYRQTTNTVQAFEHPSDRIGKRPGRKGVFARTVIYSDSDQIKKMSFGYSDEATIYLNGKAIFTGKSAFRFRDPGFLGIMDVENDAVYLNLKKGRNEIVLGVADYFGGWGFICRVDDLRGIKIE